MAKGYAIVCGVQKEPRYPGFGELKFVARDFRYMRDKLKDLWPNNFPVVELFDETATRDGLWQALQTASERCEPGDLFVFYYVGHGSERPDTAAAPDEQHDEFLVTYDHPTLDDSLAEMWIKFHRHVRMVVITDCCSSRGGMRMVGGGAASSSPKLPIRFGERGDGQARGGAAHNEPNVIPGFQGTLLHFAAADDFQGASDGNSWTHMFNRVWEAGPPANYRVMFNSIAARYAQLPKPQTPYYTPYGYMCEYVLEHPVFKVDVEWPPQF